jgi:hypothetical protein
MSEQPSSSPTPAMSSPKSSSTPTTARLWERRGRGALQVRAGVPDRDAEERGMTQSEVAEAMGVTQ